MGYYICCYELNAKATSDTFEVDLSPEVFSYFQEKHPDLISLHILPYPDKHPQKV